MAEKITKKVKVINNYGDGGGAVYALGIIGALFYFMQRAGSFPDILWGIVKSLLWPAFVVYEVLSFLQM